jgi:hypothetical protein
MFRSGAIVVGMAALMCSCTNTETEQLKVQLQEAHDREAAMSTELEGLRAEVATIKQAESEAKAAKERAWSSVRGKYRCTGGVLTGMTVRDGYARFSMGGLEQFQGNPSYPAKVRGSRLYVTDAARGTAGFRIRQEGLVLVPDSPVYAKRCKKRAG